MRYKVYGKTTVNVVTHVVAYSPEEALETAADEFYGLTTFGTDKLIGVECSFESISADNEVEWTNAEEFCPN